MTDSAFWNFVEAHAKDDPQRLRLAAAGKDFDFDVQLAILQIEARRKFGAKLRQTLAVFPRFIFPTMLAGEQCTSDLLASYHATLIPEGSTAADLTAGLGIDALHLGRRASSIVAVERNAGLAAALGYNAAGLGVTNLQTENKDCRQALDAWAAAGRRFDEAFIDPARRDSAGKRVYALADCEPDVAALLPAIDRIADTLIIKASPMLDITASLVALDGRPDRVIVLGTTTECKELLFVLGAKTADSGRRGPLIQAVTLGADGRARTFSFTREDELAAPLPDSSSPVAAGDILYEPYPAVMKAGPFRLLASTYRCHGFFGGTNLYYSPALIEDFPGHRYKVVEVLPYASKVIKRLARQYPAAEVAVRNFKMSAEELRARLGVRDSSGAVRIYGIKNSAGERTLIVTQPCGKI